MTDIPPVGLTHVALAVRDPMRSLQFYRDAIGVSGLITQMPFGFVIHTETGLNFTLFEGEPPVSVGEFHIGVSLPDADAVHRARQRFRRSGVAEHEWCDDPSLTSVKVVDPDGYLVEVSYDAVAE